jgi:hypothetical protein
MELGLLFLASDAGPSKLGAQVQVLPGCAHQSVGKRRDSLSLVASGSKSCRARQPSLALAKNALRPGRGRRCPQRSFSLPNLCVSH